MGFSLYTKKFPQIFHVPFTFLTNKRLFSSIGIQDVIDMKKQKYANVQDQYESNLEYGHELLKRLKTRVPISLFEVSSFVKNMEEMGELKLLWDIIDQNKINGYPLDEDIMTEVVHQCAKKDDLKVELLIQLSNFDFVGSAFLSKNSQNEILSMLERGSILSSSVAHDGEVVDWSWWLKIRLNICLCFYLKGLLSSHSPILQSNYKILNKIIEMNQKNEKENDEKLMTSEENEGDEKEGDKEIEEEMVVEIDGWMLDEELIKFDKEMVDLFHNYTYHLKNHE